MVKMRAALALALAAAWPAMGAHAQSTTQNITGAGSTFAAPVYQKWAELQASATGVTLNYQAVGSGAGQKLVFDHTVDFGASDGPVTTARLTKVGILQVPTVIGAEDIVVNLPGVKANQLRLTGKLIAGIYLGDITAWNDKAIAAVNPGVTLPNTPIAPVYRADGSGTTFVFTDYLSGIDPAFKDKVGAGNAVSWPAGTGAKGNAGVAGTVKSTLGAIGYVESAYATLNHLTTVQLQNHDGTFLKPSLEAFAAAAADANWAGGQDFAVDMNNAPGALSWPIVSTTYVLLPLHAANPAKSAAVIKFFDWAFDHGDAAARGLQYVALPSAIKNKVRQAWKSVQSSP
jgi:phosphate transport system substrate-binding protein